MFKKHLNKLLLNLNKKSKRNRLQSFSRQQDKFKKRYPKYKIGNATYGMPIVHSYHNSAILTIGSYCSIASNVQIYLGGQHRINWVSSYPFPMFFHMDPIYKEKCLAADSKGDVIIGSDVWLCADCTILSGVTIGHGAVIANGAMISRDVEPYAVMAGNPARQIKWRFDESTRKAFLESEWWNWSEDEINNVMHKLCNDDVSRFLEYTKSREH
ncbi:CatB-related O-acetyltransferase [Rhodoferax antarcticus]|uniref:CatB-related O-acetyltransferase n=1 Tax=Rhodoferax antarcticus TaxID=81479 RepID=UPI002223F9F7|nr:CatB-related O-acetyltransferase [Rhodoferax antarcticus]MCW2314237.1 acetyltransferase-like isoleucine patch superfamily enzyme [Rhodoferax antarcticus]